MTQEAGSHALALTLGSDDEPPELYRASVAPQAHGRDEASVIADTERRHVGVAELVDELRESLRKWRKADVLVRRGLGEVGRPLEGEDLARVLDAEFDDRQVVATADGGCAGTDEAAQRRRVGGRRAAAAADEPGPASSQAPASAVKRSRPAAAVQVFDTGS